MGKRPPEGLTELKAERARLEDCFRRVEVGDLFAEMTILGKLNFINREIAELEQPQ